MAEVVVEEKTLIARRGEIKYAKGLEGVIIGESVKSFIDGEVGFLSYCGFSIEDLAENSTYEEVAFLLLNDRLPTKRELDDFKEKLKMYRDVPYEVYDLIKRHTRYGVHPMTILRLAVDLLSVYDEDTEDHSFEANYKKSIRLISRVATITALIGRAMKSEEFVRPRDDLSHAGNWLWMYKKEVPSKEDERIFDIILILHAEHEINASTFSARAVVSSLTDIYSAVVGAIGSLKGPLHGGANEQVMKMLDEVMERGNPEECIEEKLSRREKIMGFGHRVYKSYDPRAAILRRIAEKVAEKDQKVREYLEVAKRIEAKMIEKLGKDKKLYPNVDFFSGVVMNYLGILRPLFTPIFATGRIAGWCAHILEQLQDNRIMRPRIVYIGPTDQKYIPLEKR